MVERKRIVRTSDPAYRFGSAKAAQAMQKKNGTERVPSMPVTSSCGCIFCDLRLPPNISGMHATGAGSIKCTKVESQ